MNSVLKMIFFNTLVGNWSHIIFPSFSILFMVCLKHKKVFYFSNNESKKKNCSKDKQLFKSISWSGSGRILSGGSKYNSDGSIFY